MNQRATGYQVVTPRETERKEFLPNSASLTLLWIFQWARYFDRFCLARIFLFLCEGKEMTMMTMSNIILPKYNNMGCQGLSYILHTNTVYYDPPSTVASF